MLHVSVAIALLALLWCADAVAAALPEALAAPPCVACKVDGDEARRAYSTDDWTALTAGRVVVSDVPDESAEGSRQGSIAAAGIIPHPPARVWATLVDFEAHPKFQHDAKEVRIDRVDGNRAWIAQRLRFFLVDVRFTVINTLDPVAGTIRWLLDESVEHDIGGTTGSWQLTPVADGRQTLLRYHAWIDTGRAVPAFIERFLLQRSLPNVIGSIRDEVERRSRER